MRWMILALLACGAGMAQTSDWSKLDFLMGKWTGAAGEKDTQIGAGQGAFSFEADLGGKIVVRKNQANYDSGVHHEDLLVIYREEEKPRAIYFDSEGHVIRYAVTFPESQRVVFETEAGQAGPRYRLTYWVESGVLKGRFEMGQGAGEYKTYMSWSSKRSGK